MTPLETAIAERLHAAADRIAVDVEPRAVATATRRRRRWPLVAAAAAAAAAAVVGVAAGIDGDGGSTTTTPAEDVGVVGRPEVGSVAPTVADPPDWFDPPRSAERTDALRTGPWVAAAIGRMTGDDVASPIFVAAFDGVAAMLEDSQPSTVDGRPVRVRRIDGWTALATTPTDGTPAVLVSGEVDDALLVAVLDAIVVTPVGTGFTLELTDLPDGYVEVLAPRALGPDPAPRRALTAADGDPVIYESSEWTDPLLAAMATGGDLTAVDLDGGGRGWTGTSTAQDGRTIGFLHFAPQPGVVLELVTWERSIDDLVDLAGRTSVIPVEEWDEQYR